ncbi:MAG: ATP-grasp domain-containing protein [bacterium]
MIKWIIEDFSEENGWGKLAEQAKLKGIDCYVVDGTTEETNRLISKININPFVDKVLIQSSFQFVNDITSKLPCYPYNILFTPKNYECLNYYKFLGEYLLNDDYIYLPAYEVPKSMDFLDKVLGLSEKETGRIFIRPNSGLKPVSGMIYINRYPYFEQDWNFVKREVDENELMIISTPKQIEKEYRLVIINRKVITGSLYRENGFIKYKQINIKEHKEIFDYAQEIADIYSPDLAYTIDIAELDNKLKLLEINSFCHAGLYDCDYEKIVDVLIDNLK